MKIRVILFALVLFLEIATAQNVSVTVYNNNLGVVKETRVVKIESGISKFSISDVPTEIDPTSVHIKFDGEVLEQNYQYDLANKAAILRKYVDKTVTLTDESGKSFSGKLISIGANSLTLANNNGGLTVITDLKKYNIVLDALPSGFVTKPTLEYLVKSAKGGRREIELSYFTSGMNWSAEYVAVLNKNDTEIKLNSWVSIENNSGATFRNAKIKLVAGEVNRARENAPYPIYATAKDFGGESQIKERAFFEYHIYELPRKTTLANRQKKQIAFFNAEKISVRKKYVYKSRGYSSGKKENAEVTLEFANKKTNNLGMPLPAGKVRLFKKDGQTLEFIGEDKIEHTAEGETVLLTMGKAFDVKGRTDELERKKIADDVFETKYGITIFNAKEKKIEVEAMKTFYGDWEIIGSSANYEKINSRTVKFKVAVEPKSKTYVEFTVRTKR